MNTATPAVAAQKRGEATAAARSRSDVRLANEAWEALLTAQVLLMRRFASEEVWGDLSQNEYDVLYTLAKAPNGLNLVEVNRRTLLTQGGLSRLIARLECRGFIERCTDPGDRRAALLFLTDSGREAQQAVGRRHARSVTRVMENILDREQMEQLSKLGTHIVSRFDCSASPDPPARRTG